MYTKQFKMNRFSVIEMNELDMKPSEYIKTFYIGRDVTIKRVDFEGFSLVFTVEVADDTVC